MATDDLAPLRHTLADLLASLRRDAGLTQQEVADQVGYARVTVACAETAHRLPAEVFWSKCDDLLAAGGELRRSYAQLAAARRERASRRARNHEAGRQARIARDAAVSLPVTPAGESLTLAEVEAGQPANEGWLTPATPVALGETMSPAAPGDDGRLLLDTAAESARFAQWAEVPNVGAFTLDEVHVQLRALAHAYLAAPPLPVFQRTRLIRDQVFELLRGHQHPSQTRGLYRFAGYSCTLLAWISGDLGQTQAADTHARTAWLCAQMADSAELRAWVLAAQSKTAFWAGNYADAAALARSGGEHAPSTTARVFLAAQRADALSMTGAAVEARDAVTAALAARDGIRSPDSLGGILSCGPARLANYTSAVHLRLGDTNASLQATSTALDAYANGDERAYGTEAQIHITRGQVFLARRDLDGAAEALRPVLDLPTDRRLDTLSRRLRQVQHQLSGPDVRSGAAAALRERIETFHRAAAVNAAAHPRRKEIH